MINDDIDINKFLNDLLAIVRAKKELDLITKLLDGVDKIWLDNWSERMKVKELIKNLQKHDPNQEIILLNGNSIYTIDSDDSDMLFSQKYLNNIVIMHLKRLQ